jgi:hypothetical protein
MEKTMSKIITLSFLGLTLALGGAALISPVNGYAEPASRSAFLERTGTGDQLQNHYRHKRLYQHDQRRNRENSGASRLPDRGENKGLGTARPELRKPVLPVDPAVLRGPAARQRPQVA